MTAVVEPTDWIQRLQEMANQTSERSTASLATIQRLLVAVGQAQFAPESLATALPRFGQEHGAEIYDRLTRLTATFLADLLTLVGRSSGDYLMALVPSRRIVDAGPRPIVPRPPDYGGQADWTAWYQLFGARVSEQQAWVARLYRVLLDEVAAGRLAPDAVQSAGGTFVRERLPEMLADIAELTSNFLTAALSVADDSVEELFGALFGEVLTEELVINARGAVGTTFTSGLLVESARAEVTTVSCEVAAAPGFRLSATPVEFNLAPGESRIVTVRVVLDDEPTDGYVSAGTVVIRGQGERDLVVRVRAHVEDAQT